MTLVSTDQRRPSARPGARWGLTTLVFCGAVYLLAAVHIGAQQTQPQQDAASDTLGGATPPASSPITVPAGVPTVGPAGPPPAQQPQAPLGAVDPTAGDWAQRVDDFAQLSAAGAGGTRAGIALYDSLRAEIDLARSDLALALNRGDMDASRPRDARLVALYRERDTLLRLLDPAALAGLFGLTRTGLDEVVDELEFFWIHSRFETTVARSTARSWLARWINDPLGWVPEFLKLALAFLVFLWWRRKIPPYLTLWRKRLLEIRPIQRQNLRLAKFLWYFERVHLPVEWLVLLTIVFNVTAAQNFGPALFFWAVAKWILIGWILVLAIDALAARGAVGRRDHTGLRRRSLWVICWWIVAFSLGRQLVRDFFGEGALFHWVSVALLLLLIPVGALLVYWWRDEVVEGLEADPNQTAVTAWLLRHPTGAQSYLTSLLGGLYLTYDGVRRTGLRWMGSLDMGRRVLAQLSRSEIARQATKDEDLTRGQPLPPDVRAALIAGEGALVDKVGRQHLSDLIGLFTNQPGSVAMIAGARGAGKSCMIDRLKEKLGESAIRVSCPMRSFDQLVSRLGQAAGHPGTSLDELPGLLAARPGSVVIIDDLHRLGRPVIGGMDDVNHVAALIRATGNTVSWLHTVDATAWEYLRRFRELEPLHNHSIVLAPWGEEEIGRMVASRCEAAGIDPDFSTLELPRQLDERTYESPAARNRAGFMRVLWDDCGGNPGAALHLWADSLVVDPAGNVIVQLSHPPAVGDLDGLGPSTFFVLRTIIRLEAATEQEIADSLPIDLDDVEDVLQYTRTLGIVQEQDGLLSLGWRWDRAVNRALSRRNMIE